MKRFWLVLLSLGLIMAFSASAFAVDVKVSGNFEVGGLYLSKTSVNADNTLAGNPDINTAFFYQKLRVGTDFIVAPCLKLVTQFDALDRIWVGARGGAFPAGATDNTGGTSGTRDESQNFVMNLVYIDYTSPVGLFRVGYQPDFVWGTAFGDRGNGKPAGQILYIVPVGPVTILADWAKEADNSLSAIPNTSPVMSSDSDFDSFRLAGVFNFNTSQAKGEAGALLLYNRDASNRSLPGYEASPLLVYGVPYLMNAYNLVPYFKVQTGPLAIQGELNYGFGDAAKWEYGTQSNVKIDTLSVFLDATANLGQVYVGGSFAYVSGDDPGSHDKLEGGVGNTGGLDWNPCLIMFNTDLNYWAGDILGEHSTVNGEMSNAWFFQGRAGVKPIPQLDVQLAVSYAQADKKPNPNPFIPVLSPGGHKNPFPNGSYGWEVDVTGTYKITNNLSYMLGIGYLFTGDYFKGYDTLSNNQVQNDYLLINKLVLSF